MVPLTPLVDNLPLSGDDLPEAAFAAILAYGRWPAETVRVGRRETDAVDFGR